MTGKHTRTTIHLVYYESAFDPMFITHCPEFNFKFLFLACFFHLVWFVTLAESSSSSSFLANTNDDKNRIGMLASTTTTITRRSSTAVAAAFVVGTRAFGGGRVKQLNINGLTKPSYSMQHRPSCCTATRLFGTKRGVEGNPLGTIAIYNDQKAIKTIDEKALHTTVQRISKIIGYETYDVTLLLVEDEEMRETNLESRGIDAPTDILSFPFLEAQEAGLLEEPEFDIPDYYTLGDMVIDVPYVMRRCQEDSEDGVEDDDEDRGVSGAMANVSDPEKRIHMLLVHGMLHLVGYDHEEDDEYEEMVEREEEILKELGYI